MTKLKNTKKGMAKKALSISLVAAMLATSNVPVWAAEDLFSDGSAAVEAPAVEEPAAEVDTFSAEPVEETTNTVQTQATSTNDDYEVTLGTTLEEAVEDGITWGGSTTFSDVSVSGDLTNKTVYYTWKDSNGLAIAASDTLSNGVKLDLTNGAQYAGKSLNLYIYIQQNGSTIWEYTSDAIKVNAIDVSTIYDLAAINNVTYNGKEQKESITLSAKSASNPLSETDFTVSYDGDTTNVTTNGVTVKATVNRQGYTGTLTTTYKIEPLELTDSNFADYVNASVKNTSMPYTGANLKIYASDISLTDKNTGTDLSYLLNSTSAVATLSGVKTVGQSGTPTITVQKNTDKTRNFYVGTKFTVDLEDEVTVVARDLSTVSVTIGGQKYTGNQITLKGSNATYKDENGNILTLANDVAITTPDDAIEPGLYTATVTPASGNKNVTGETSTEFSIYSTSLEGVVFEDMAYAKEAVTYTGQAITKDLSKLGKVFFDADGDGVIDSGETVLSASEYEIQFGENITAGTDAGKIYIVGKGSYSGTREEITFDINKAKADNVSANDYVEYVAGAEPADYKDALGLKVTADNNALTLTEGTDYTVEYSFVNSNGKEVDSNEVGNFVKATVTILNSNIDKTGVTLSASVEITNTVLKDSYIVMNQTSYEYTGQTITPDFDVVVNGRTIAPNQYTIESITNGTDVGTATFVIKAVEDGIFDSGSTAKGTFTITPADTSKLEVVIPAQQYTGYTIIPDTDDFKVTFNSVEYDASFIEKNFNLTYGENIQMGEGTVTLTPKSTTSNFTGTKTVTFQISGTIVNGGDLNYYDENGLILTDIGFKYDGKAHTPAKTTYQAPSGYSLTEGTDYEIKYVDNIYGKEINGEQYGAVLVIAKGTYAGDFDQNGVENGIYTTADGTKIENVIYAEQFEITQKSISRDNVTVDNGVYAGGLPVDPQVTIYVDGVLLVEGTDYELEVDGKDLTNATTTKELTVKINPINGYEAGNEDLSFNWGIDKFNLANATVSISGTNVALKCGKVDIDPSEYTVAVDGTTVTVTAAEDSKNYTGTKTIDIELEDEKPAAPVIESVNVSGNNATVVLAGESDGATGYDYVISTDRDCITTKDYDKVNKNMLTTETTFTYTEQGIYYAYCHSWKRVDGVKVFSDWSEAYPFAVTSITPEQPVITKLEKSSNGKHLRITWTQCENATGYDVVMGTKLQKVNGEYRPTEYGKAVKKVTNGNTVSVIFYNIPSGTYYVGLHAYNRTSETGVKVFSPWSNSKEVKF